MSSFNLALIGDEELASKLAKKGTVSDVTFYNIRQGDVMVNIFAPTRFPEKAQALAYSLNYADAVLLVVSELGKQLGEILLAIDARGLKKAFVVLRNYILPEQIAPFLKSTSLTDIEFLEDSETAIRERIMVFVPERPAQEDDTLRIHIDQHFNVKGVGTVALGLVSSGRVKKHQDLQVYPTDKKAHVRSIQVHDVDVDEAGVGSRVGLALKSIESDELDRGYIMSTPGALGKAEEMRLELHKGAFWKGKLEPGIILHLSSGMQFCPGRVTGVESMSPTPGTQVQTGSGDILGVDVKLEKRMTLDGSRLMVLQIDSNPRVVGWAVPMP